MKRREGGVIFTLLTSLLGSYDRGGKLIAERLLLFLPIFKAKEVLNLQERLCLKTNIRLPFGPGGGTRQLHHACFFYAPFVGVFFVF